MFWGLCEKAALDDNTMDHLVRRNHSSLNIRYNKICFRLKIEINVFYQSVKPKKFTSSLAFNFFVRAKALS